MSDVRILKGRFRLFRVLQRGSMGVTYLAEDLEAGVEVVVKEVAFGELDRLKQIELFQREAQLLENLAHPAIPKLIDSFEESGPATGDVRLYLVQEHRAGKNLQELVKGGWHGSAAEIEQIVRGIAAVLAYLHSRLPPLIHRDIKPANVLLHEDGRISVIDLGAASNRVFAPEGPGGSTIVGTPGYVPLEQFAGHAVRASDLYALGMVAVFLATHREPAELLTPDGRVEYRSLTEIDRPSLVSAIDRMIEPRVSDRVQSVEALLVILDGRDAIATTRRSTRRTRGIVGTFLSAALGTIALVASRIPVSYELLEDWITPPTPAAEVLALVEHEFAPRDEPACKVQLREKDQTRDYPCEIYGEWMLPIAVGPGRLRTIVDQLPETLQAQDSADERSYVIDLTPSGVELFAAFSCPDGLSPNAAAVGAGGQSDSLLVLCAGESADDRRLVAVQVRVQRGTHRVELLSRPVRFEYTADASTLTLVVPSEGPALVVYRRENPAGNTSWRVQPLARGALSYDLAIGSAGGDIAPDALFLRGARLFAVFPAIANSGDGARQEYRQVRRTITGARDGSRLELLTESRASLICNHATTSAGPKGGLELRLPNDFGTERLVAQIPDAEPVPGPTILPCTAELCLEPNGLRLATADREIAIDVSLPSDHPLATAACTELACVVAFARGDRGIDDFVAVRLPLTKN
ncbi:MAG: serine/threonine protein kinase [Deltaproteobacteria bacterium]|nr:serine/threonine protein kinase [Deltaproteobacteria bacterium]